MSNEDFDSSSQTHQQFDLERPIITCKKNFVPKLTSTTMHSVKAHRSSRLITGR